MKRKILLVITGLALTAFSGFAQESGLGAKGGLNFATLTGDVEDAGLRTSIHLGGYYTHMFTDVLAVQAELMYSGQGAKSTDVTVKYNYLNLPFMARYFVSENISLDGGLQFGFLLGAKAEVDGNSATIKDVNGLDLSLGLGATYELESALSFSIRYNLGLSNTYSGEGSGSVKNSVIQLTVGYRFTEDALF